MTFFWYLIIMITCLIFIFLVSLIPTSADQDKEYLIKEYVTRKMNELYCNSNLFVYKTYSAIKAIGINKSKHVIIFGKSSSLDTLNHRSYPFNQIIDVKMDVNGETVTQSSHIIGRAIVGGVLAGGIGAIIGGLSGSKNNKQIVKSIKLKILLSDLDNPVEEIIFFNDNNGEKNDSYQVKTATNEAEIWFNLLSVIIKQNQNSYSPNGGVS